MPNHMKNLIVETFFTMVGQKGIDKVTVKDLVETCHISRQTFYYHFQDILDVIQWSAQQGIQAALERSLAEEDPEQAICAYIRSSIDHWSVIQKLLQSQKHAYIEQIIVDGLKVYLTEMVRRKTPERMGDPEDLNMAVAFYAYGIAGVMLEQCGKPDCDPQRLAQQFHLVLGGYGLSGNVTGM